MYRIYHPVSGVKVIKARSMGEACWMYPSAYSVEVFVFA